LHLVPSWHQKGILLPELNWPDNQIFEAEKIKKVPSWNKKGTQLFQKKARYFIAILCIASEAVSLKELLMGLDYKNEKVFRDNYLKPLRNCGLLTITNPAVPTDPDNKYYITEKGRAFLGAQSSNF